MQGPYVIAVLEALSMRTTERMLELHLSSNLGWSPG